MKISSKDVIQADSAPRVMTAIDAVARGARTDEDIAKAIGGLDRRQGRYYRRAAEVLGFLNRRSANSSVLSNLGKKYARSVDKMKLSFFTQAFLSNPLVTRLIPFLEAQHNKATRQQLETFLSSVAALGKESMAHRRVSSYIGWMRFLGLADLHEGTLVFNGLPVSAPIMNISSDEEPILPKTYDFHEYEQQAQRVRSSKHVMPYLVNQASRERALKSHTTLVNMMAERLRQHGAIPRSNRYVDLCARVGDADYLFEMKSTTVQNLHNQVRLGVSQLLEYRYIQNVADAFLVLVIEIPLPRSYEWMVDYLIVDRKILLVWDGNGRFDAPGRISKHLLFLREPSAMPT